MTDEIAAQPPPDVMEWLHETYKPEGVEIWLRSWRKADPERRAFLERLAGMDGMGT